MVLHCGGFMNKFARRYLLLIIVFAVIWMAILGIAYKQVTQHDDFLTEEMHTHAKHTVMQVQELFKWFDDKQEVFVPAALNDIATLAPNSSITTNDGRVFTMPLPINLVKRIKNQIQDGVRLRFVSNNPINPQNKINNAANIALITALESSNLVFFEFNEDKNEFRYVKPLIATKSCLTCHVDVNEHGLIGAVIVDIDPAEFIHDAKRGVNVTILMTITASFVVLLAFCALSIYILRRYKHQFENIENSQQMATNMSQEIELVLSNVGHILTELKQGDLDDSRRDSLIKSLQTINKDLLNTSFKIQAGGADLHQQEEVFHVEDLFNNCMQIFYTQCAQKNLKFTLHIDRSVPTYLLGNAYHLRQILVRLLKFSISYTHKGSVDIRVNAVTNISSRFHIADLNHLPIHLIVEVEDTGIGYVVTDKQHLLQRFAKIDHSGRQLNTRPVISLAPVNEIAMLLDGNVSISNNSKKGSCFKLVAQMKLIEEGITPRSQGKLESARDVLALDKTLQEIQKSQKQATTSVVTPFKKGTSIVIANSEIETLDPEIDAIWKKENLHVQIIRNATNGFAFFDKPNHGFSVVFLRKLADMDIVYAATRIRYIEKSHPENPPLAIVLIADEVLKTDMEALRFFNISSVDHVPRDPYAIIKLTSLVLSTHKNKIVQGDMVFDETSIEESKEKYFDINKAIKNTKNDKQLLTSICSMWIRFYPAQIERLETIGKEDDREIHLRLVRSIKNSAGTVSLPMLWAEANRLEKRLLENKEIRYEKLLSIYEQTFEYMKEHFG